MATQRKIREVSLDDGDVDAGQAETSVCRALLLTSPSLHPSLESQLTETIGTQFVNDFCQI